MATHHFDIVLLTQNDYVNPHDPNPYINNVLLEDQLLTTALEAKGFCVTRTNWDNKNFDWTSARFALFRAVWDYFHRFDEFHGWLRENSQHIKFINPYSIIQWNMDKHYLAALQQKNINIPPTLFLEQGERVTLDGVLNATPWAKAILKPAIAGGARHTYFFERGKAYQYQDIFQLLIVKEAMLVQEFQEHILSRGELSFMVFGGTFSHAVLKKAKAGDFRVQDDFGGSVQPYYPAKEEVLFVEHVIAQCEEKPVYARVDVMWDNQNQLCVSELEMIEPELWFRTNEGAAKAMATAVYEHCHTKEHNN